MIRVRGRSTTRWWPTRSEERPFECCGLLAGTDGAITRSHRAKNVAEQFGIRYELDPREYLS